MFISIIVTSCAVVYMEQHELVNKHNCISSVRLPLGLYSEAVQIDWINGVSIHCFQYNDDTTSLLFVLFR